MCTLHNDTGGWHGPAFIACAYQAVAILAATTGEASLNYVYHVFPLRVLKQIVERYDAARVRVAA